MPSVVQTNKFFLARTQCERTKTATGNYARNTRGERWVKKPLFFTNGVLQVSYEATHSLRSSIHQSRAEQGFFSLASVYRSFLPPPPPVYLESHSERDTAHGSHATLLFERVFLASQRGAKI